MSLSELRDVGRLVDTRMEELKAVVDRINDGLSKLHVGFVAWVPAESDMVQGRQVPGLELGYCKQNGQWGLAVQIGKSSRNPEDNFKWKFNEAPRPLRVATIGALPRLLAKLNEMTVELARDTVQATVLAVSFLEAIQAAQDELDREKREQEGGV